MELTKRILKNIQNLSAGWMDDFVSLCKYLKKLQDKGKIEVKNPIEMFI